MRIQQITEASPLTVRGSLTPDLLLSKLWLWQELTAVLSNLDIDRVHAVYVLGSWTGTVSMILAHESFPADVIINVDQDPDWIRASEDLVQRMGYQDQVVHVTADANTVDFAEIPQPIVVINTSTNDIESQAWFDHIPRGAIVVLQGRDRVNTQQWSSLDDFQSHYDLDQVLFRGQVTLQDPETQYNRYMIIHVR